MADMAESGDTKDVRVRTLTPKGEELYKSSKAKFETHIDQLWVQVENTLEVLTETKQDLKELRKTEHNIKDVKQKYSEVGEEYINFLNRQNTHDSNTTKAEFKVTFFKCIEIIDKLLSQIKELRLEEAERMSDNNSNRSSTASQKRQKAEVERTKLEYMKQQTELIKEQATLEHQKANLQAELSLLAQKQDTAVAEAELKAAEDVENVSQKSLSFKLERDQPISEVRKTLTQKYVDNQFNEIQNKQSVKLNPDAEVFQVPVQQPQEPSIVANLTQFLLKKDLLLTRFQKFDDTPEMYVSWKASFKSIVEELQVTPFEEMDLLIKWLGPKSSTFSQSIRSTNIHDPESGVFRIWERLDDRFGKPEMVESSFKRKLQNFAKITNKDHTRYYELLDVLIQIESTKENPIYTNLLSYFDTSSGVTPIIEKLPFNIQEKWITRASRYKTKHNVHFIPFSELVDFIREISSIKNDPGFMYQQNDNSTVKPASHVKNTQRTNIVKNFKTEVNQNSSNSNSELYCPIHKTSNHNLTSCRVFKAKNIRERKQFLKENRYCFKCCNSDKHVSKTCTVPIKCDRCGNNNHVTLMHYEKPESDANGGEDRRPTSETEVTVNTKHTSLGTFSGRSCGKTVLLCVYPKGQQDKAKLVYAILDDQSNKTLGTSDLFDALNIETKPVNYTLSSCSGMTSMCGRSCANLIIESLSGDYQLELPPVIECSSIPNDRSEIPTPEVAKMFPHLEHLADKIPNINPDAQIQLLIGRDVPDAHHVIQQVTGDKGSPFAQKLKFGWTIIGDVCLGKFHKPIYNVRKTHVIAESTWSRESIFEPCRNNLCIHEGIFHKTKDDEEIGMSVEDKEFLKLMDSEFEKDATGRWTAPLPFRPNRKQLPDNRVQAWKRAQILDASLRKSPTKKTHFVEFMTKIFSSGAAEVAPKMSDDEQERWYLPLFGVYHPNKPNQIRGVFDSSASFNGVSLNSVLLSGPDLTNNLLGILLRFRTDEVAATADIEQMFYQFYVKKEHRDYLRFFWYRNNNPDDILIEYRMCVHVFGNSPSPAIATYGLRRAVDNCNQFENQEVKQFVNQDFYVDDGLVSMPTSKQVVEILTKTKDVLMSEGQIRLHKFMSNNSEVMKAFDQSELGKDMKDLNLGEDVIPMQHSLGLVWDLNSDCFVFNPLVHEKPLTRRGVLSALNSIFDPIGFLSPLTISGKILLRDASPPGTDWDDPLSHDFVHHWNNWRQSVLMSKDLSIPRMFVDCSVTSSSVVKKELYIFSDASEKAIAASAYLKIYDCNGTNHVGFVMGKSKLAPHSGNTIPRLELCGAVLATEIGKFVSDNLDIPLDSIKYFTDSKVTLGYISNRTRRFYTYVSNRVDRILAVSSPEQWNFVVSEKNPADCATRYSPQFNISTNCWLTGPEWLINLPVSCNAQSDFPLIAPEEDKEIRPESSLVNVSKTSFEPQRSIVSRFSNFSSWWKLVRAISLLKHIGKNFNCNDTSCKGWHYCVNYKSLSSFKETEIFILKEVQKEAYSKEIECLSNGKKLPRQSSIIDLSPFLDSSGILRVGGRLNKVKDLLASGEINPIIVPKQSHIATLLIEHHHKHVFHQGRHLTEGALRKAGFWIIGAKRAISSFIRSCVTCRRLRGKIQTQKMADLPTDRLTPGPPFTNVGLDTFGPWQVVTRKTRGGSAESKRWAILFSCLTTRAVHIEVIDSLNTSSFINALIRFQSIRGSVKVYRSDCGTNFVGAVNSLNGEAINVEDSVVKDFLLKSGAVWKFNPPHSSHMGGVWERMIGVTRRILEAVILKSSNKNLTHDCLVTFMAEVVAILNSRPIANISTDPQDPLILSPSMLLTGKQEYLPVVAESFDIKDMYRAEWKHVQYLSSLFWKHWRSDYLTNLQKRRKWFDETENVKEGDVILLRDKSLNRCDWPLGLIVDTVKSSDDKVRKATVRVYRDGKTVTYTRPISEMVLLVT